MSKKATKPNVDISMNESESSDTYKLKTPVKATSPQTKRRASSSPRPERSQKAPKVDDIDSPARRLRSHDSAPTVMSVVSNLLERENVRDGNSLYESALPIYLSF